MQPQTHKRRHGRDDSSSDSDEQAISAARAKNAKKVTHIELSPEEVKRLFATSLTTNPRNLECNWYPYVDDILKTMTTGFPTLVVASQQQLYFTADQDNAAQLTGLLSTLDPDLSIQTASTEEPGSKPTISKVPDTLIVCLRIRRRYEHGPISVDNAKVRYTGYPLISEGKRGGPRRAANPKAFEIQTIGMLEHAQEQAIKQAAVLFMMRPRQDRVILMIYSGEWWQCIDMYRGNKVIQDALRDMLLSANSREEGSNKEEGDDDSSKDPALADDIADHPHPMDESDIEDDEMEDEELEDEEIEDEETAPANASDNDPNNASKTLPNHAPTPEDPGWDQGDFLHDNHYAEGADPRTETLIEERRREALPTARWTGRMRFTTSISDHYISLIRERLVWCATPLAGQTPRFG